MQALWLEKQKTKWRTDLPLPQQEGQALIKVRLAGICGTDLEMTRGYYPFTGIPGHEFVGEVVANAPAEWIGKRGVGEFNLTCGNCHACQTGSPTHCENRSVLGILGKDGVFAEYASLPLANLHLVPDDVPDEMAVFTEPLAAALEINQQTHIQPSQRILLVGAGRLGLLTAQTLALTGADLQVLARYPRQIEILHNQGIATIREEEIRPRAYDVVVEATGSAAGFALAQKALRPRGTLALKSTYAGNLTLNMSALVVDEIQLIGSRCGPFAPALRLMQSRRVNPLPLIAAEFPLNQAAQALEQAGQRGMLKVLLRNGG